MDTGSEGLATDTEGARRIKRKIVTMGTAKKRESVRDKKIDTSHRSRHNSKLHMAGIRCTSNTRLHEQRPIRVVNRGLH